MMYCSHALVKEHIWDISNVIDAEEIGLMDLGLDRLDAERLFAQCYTEMERRQEGGPVLLSQQLQPTEDDSLPESQQSRDLPVHDEQQVPGEEVVQLL